MTEILKASDTKGGYVPTKEDKEKLRFKPDHLKLSWDGIFHTVQGEGNWIWLQTTFMRLHMCNLQCSRCDAFYTRKSDVKEFYSEPYDVHINQLLAHIVQAQQDKWVMEKCKNVTITGGEPMMQQRMIEKRIKDSYFEDWKFQIETNGTIMPSEYLLMRCKYNCSPKLLSSDNKHKRAYKINVLKAISEKSEEPCFKFVVKTNEDIDEVLKNYSFLPKHQIYIMPEGVRVEENMRVYENTIDYIIEKGLNTTPRLQNVCFDWARRWV